MRRTFPAAIAVLAVFALLAWTAPAALGKDEANGAGGASRPLAHPNSGSPFTPEEATVPGSRADRAGPPVATSKKEEITREKGGERRPSDGLLAAPSKETLKDTEHRNSETPPHGKTPRGPGPAPDFDQPHSSGTLRAGSSPSSARLALSHPAMTASPRRFAEAPGASIGVSTPASPPRWLPVAALPLQLESRDAPAPLVGGFFGPSPRAWALLPSAFPCPLPPETPRPPSASGTPPAAGPERATLLPRGRTARLEREDVLRHPLRAQLLALLAREPGLHLRALARRLNLAPQHAAQHLRVLEKAGLLSSADVAGRKIFAITGARIDASAGAAAAPLGPHAARPCGGDAALLRARLIVEQTSRAALLRAVLACPGSRQLHLARLTGQHPSAAARHLRTLAGAGLVEERSVAGQRRYEPTALAVHLAHGADADRAPRASLPRQAAESMPRQSPAGDAPAAHAIVTV